MAPPITPKRAERQERRQQHRPPAEAIRQIADHGRAQEQHRGEGKGQPAGVFGRGGIALMGQRHHDLGRHRDDDPDADHIDADSGKKENERVAPAGMIHLLADELLSRRFCGTTGVLPQAPGWVRR
jgi:hypothetical protein